MSKKDEVVIKKENLQRAYDDVKRVLENLFPEECREKIARGGIWKSDEKYFILTRTTHGWIVSSLANVSEDDSEHGHILNEEINTHLTRFHFTYLPHAQVKVIEDDRDE